MTEEETFISLEDESACSAQFMKNLEAQTHQEIENSNMNELVNGLFDYPRLSELRLKKSTKTQESINLLREEFRLNPKWTKEMKEHFANKYDLKFQQVYKLHWDWKEKAKRAITAVLPINTK